MSIDVPKGFSTASVHCGIKSDASREDLVLIVADEPCTAAGVYTTNVVFSAAVGRNRQITPSDKVRVVIANSGNANTCTGERGKRDTNEMVRLAAETCKANPDQGLVMSTGIIGEYLPMDKIRSGIAAAANKLGDDEDHFMSAARGLLTTDKSHKVSCRKVGLSQGDVQVAGMAKGAGMIGPKMATMLCVIMTDAALLPADAQSALSDAAEESFNCMSVEGHMSTSDTLLLLASGAAGGEPIAGDNLQSFAAALTDVCVELAKMMADDGEGANHLIDIVVEGCASRDDAHQIAKTVANSTLVKTGIAGADPNWGRIVSAAGYSGVQFNPEKLSLSLNGFDLYERGTPKGFDEQVVSSSIRDQRETFIRLTLEEGDARCQFWTSDLTVDYVRFNSEYHT